MCYDLSYYRKKEPARIISTYFSRTHAKKIGDYDTVDAKCEKLRLAAVEAYGHTVWKKRRLIACKRGC